MSLVFSIFYWSNIIFFMFLKLKLGVIKKNLIKYLKLYLTNHIAWLKYYFIILSLN